MRPGAHASALVRGKASARNLRSYLAYWGPVRLLHKLALVLLKRLLGVRLYDLHERPIETPAPKLNAPAEFSGRVFVASEIQELLRRVDEPEALELSPAFIRRAFAQGHVCEAILHGERLIGYAWVSLGPTRHVDGDILNVGPPHAYRFKSFTLPAYRGRHLQRHFSDTAADYLLTRGRTQWLAIIEPFNHSSLHLSFGKGARHIGRVGFWKCGRLFLPIRSSSLKGSAIEFIVPDTTLPGEE